jgi:hypothetical protein
MVTESQLGWEVTRRHIHLQLGNIHLRKIPVWAVASKAPLPQLIGAPAVPELPFERFSKEIDLLILGSYPCKGRLPTYAILPNSFQYVVQQGPHFYIEFSGTFDDYLAGRSAKSRWTLKKKVRRLSDASKGEMVVRKYNIDEHVDFHKAAYPLSTSTYQGNLLQIGIPELNAFSSEMETVTDWRGYIMFIGSKPIAFMSLPIAGNTLIYDRVGYDQTFYRLSPGTVLQYLAIKDLFETENFQYMDLTAGDGLHKELFGNRSTEAATIYYFRRNMRGLYLLSVYAGCRTISSSAVRVLDKLGLRARLKRAVKYLAYSKHRKLVAAGEDGGAERRPAPGSHGD